jgi:hypothetical protein
MISCVPVNPDDSINMTTLIPTFPNIRFTGIKRSTVTPISNLQTENVQLDAELMMTEQAYEEMDEYATNKIASQ